MIVTQTDDKYRGDTINDKNAWPISDKKACHAKKSFQLEHMSPREKLGAEGEASDALGA